MIDFKKLAGKTPKIDYRDPIAIHKNLDSEVSHSHLRDVQREALEKFRACRTEKDIVVKMSTGSGKTTVGLLMLKSHMAETQRPGVYLCPTHQLVQQVVSEAKKLGLKAEVYKGAHPAAEAIRGEQILVMPYEKLFNARSTFDRTDVELRPVAIVLDDAHTGIEKIRGNFTLTWNYSNDVYSFISNLVADSIRQQNPGKAESITQHDPHAVIEVPYWTWFTNIGLITKRLAKDSESDALLYKWAYVRDDLSVMRCILSGSEVEISPEIINFRHVPAYFNADHRIFMSATLADDSVLVRDLNRTI